MEDTVTTNVIKRNGEEVHFDRAKIVNAITKANGNVERIHQMNPYQIEAIADTKSSLTGLRCLPEAFFLSLA